MRIGLIADAHANADALRVVLADMPSVDTLVFAGDAVGYYAHPNETCAMLRAANAICVRGNHELYVCGLVAPDESRRAAYRTDWTRDELSPENLAWLRQLPAEATLNAAGSRIMIRHASPWDEQTYLYPDSSRLADVALQPDEVLVLGHTHHPLAYPAGAGLLVNPGSVGQPRDWDPRASYAILSLPSRNVEFRRAAYDVAAVQEHLTFRHWPEGVISILSRTR